MGAAAWMRPPRTFRIRGLCCWWNRYYRPAAPQHLECTMSSRLSVVFTGVRFDNPFLLSSAPPSESDSNIMRAFEAGWGGVVTKTIGLHPVVNVRGPKTKFIRATPESSRLSMEKRSGTALHSSWNWELISD